MKGKHHILLYTFLGLALVIAVFAAIDGHTRANQSAQFLSDAYAQRLLEAQEHLQAISLKLQKAPVATDASTCVELLATVSREADEVVSSLTALPLSHQAMGDTVAFCNQLSEYTLGLALLAASGSMPDQQAAEQLSQLRAQCSLLAGQFATAQNGSVQLSLAPGVFYEPVSLSDRPLEQVADPDRGMDYPTMIYDGAFSDARHLGQPKALGPTQVDQQQAIEIARDFVGSDRVSSAGAGVETGGTIECWGVTLTLRDGTVLNADVTRQGGKLLWIMPEHASFTPALTLEECTQAAQAFLTTHGYGTMEPTHYQVYDGLAVISFAAVQDGVLLYPDLIKVQLRMDTGELVGLESNNYLMNHTRRASLTPALDSQQALQRVSSRLHISGTRLCVIPYRDSERLCWEVKGTYDGNDYQVYIDAANGQELEVLMMVDSAEGRLAA